VKLTNLANGEKEAKKGKKGAAKEKPVTTAGAFDLGRRALLTLWLD
jgi:hypothetical protein